MLFCSVLLGWIEMAKIGCTALDHCIMLLPHSFQLLQMIVISSLWQRCIQKFARSGMEKDAIFLNQMNLLRKIDLTEQ